MYKIFCEKCGNNNYSASRAGKWICCHCGVELQNNSGKKENDGKKVGQLA